MKYLLIIQKFIPFEAETDEDAENYMDNISADLGDGFIVDVAELDYDQAPGKVVH